MKLNILFLNSIDKSVWGGLENWMEICGRGLAQRGHKILVGGRRNSLFLERISGDAKLEVIPLDISGDFDPGAVSQIGQIISQDNIHATLCNFVKDVRLAGMARKLSRMFRLIWTPGVNLAKKSFSHKLLFSNFVDLVIVPSNHLRDNIADSGYIEKGRFKVIPIGIDENLWRGNREEGREFIIREYNLPDNAFLCLTSGRFVKQKGHNHLIEAARILCDRYPNIYFLLLGEGPLQANLAAQIKNHRLGDRFVFCGLLKDHRKVVFGADLYVHPAIIEPYGIVLVEAMAAALPVVATRVGGIPEVVNELDTALLVDPADPEQLTKAIERLYNDSALRENYGKAGHDRFVGHFRLDTMIDRLEKVILGLVDA